MTEAPQAKTEMPIVLTASVIPNGVKSATGPQARLAQYLKVLKFYQQFAPIIFLENSGYPLDQHPEFHETPRLQVKKFQPSSNPGRGKGYQEFEMLDAWLAAEMHPPARWLKISGRYQICNIRRILAECGGDKLSQLLIDQVKNRASARTYLFCVETNFYRERLRGLYQRCDDQAGNWIEQVLFHEIQDVLYPRIRVFKNQPHLAATDGSSGIPFPSGRGQWLTKQILRGLNRLLDRRYLRYQT